MTTVTDIITEVSRQHLAILGKTGSGKSTTARDVIEGKVEEDARVCILDSLKSDWWGITLDRAGTGAGYPFVIFGGPHQHVPCSDQKGADVARLVARGDVRLSIIDMADFGPGGLQRFFIDFAEVLFKELRGVLYLVLEEAHEFAPKERAGIGGENLAIHWAKKLAAAGRSKGLRLVVITQRVQSLHNAVLGSCDTLIAHRITLPADQKPVTDWLKANVAPDVMKQVTGEMSKLPTGTGWVCSGEAQIYERVTFPVPRTYDNTRTPTDKDGKRVMQAPPLDAARLAEIAAMMGEPQQPEPTADQQIAAVGAHSRGWEDGHKVGFEEGRRMGYSEGMAFANRGFEATVTKASGLITAATAKIHTALSEMEANAVASHSLAPPAGAFPHVKVVATAGGENAGIKTTVQPRPLPDEDDTPRQAPLVDAGLNPAQQSIVDTLQRSCGVPLTLKLIGHFSGRSPDSGPHRAAMKAVRDAGLIEQASGGWCITSAGAAASLVANMPVLADEVELWGRWRGRIADIVTPASMAMLAGLLRAGAPLTLEQWGLMMGNSTDSGPWRKRAKALRDWQLIETDGRRWSVTQKGMTVAGVVDVVHDLNAHLQTLRYDKLSQLAQRMYACLPATRRMMGERLGMSTDSGPWRGAIKELLTSKLAAESDGLISRIPEDLA